MLATDLSHGVRSTPHFKCLFAEFYCFLCLFVNFRLAPMVSFLVTRSEICGRAVGGQERGSGNT